MMDDQRLASLEAEVQDQIEELERPQLESVGGAVAGAEAVLKVLTVILGVIKELRSGIKPDANDNAT
jgi:hypothetical protein